MSEETSVRDNLARDRGYLANERTLLAYLRTALALIGLGICTGFFGVYRFFHYQSLIEKR